MPSSGKESLTPQVPACADLPSSTSPRLTISLVAPASVGPACQIMMPDVLLNNRTSISSPGSTSASVQTLSSAVDVRPTPKTAAVATPDPPRTRATSRDCGGQGWLRAVDRQHDRIGGEGAPNGEEGAVSTGALLSARDDEREDGGRSRTGRPLRPTAPYDPGSGITGHTKLLTTPRSVAPAPVGSASADASSAFVSITPSAFRS